MNILIIGDVVNFEECQQKFGQGHAYTLTKHQQEAEKFFGKQDVIFDFIIEEHPDQMEVYRDHPTVIAFLNTVKVNLAQLAATVNHQITCTLFGFPGIPTFLNREILETSLYKLDQNSRLEEVCTKLKTSFQYVEDRVGLVTPRVICMIINEAYYTVQEGTATREDIDLAMKLGTNYPYGPFEWAGKIGVKNVYEVLQAVYADTKDERYKICPLLKEEYLFHRN
ncbi:MAG: 3-hydroxyacyl-CoA dehydrogenase family protein [Bacteroidota bacterium]